MSDESKLQCYAGGLLLFLMLSLIMNVLFILTIADDVKVLDGVKAEAVRRGYAEMKPDKDNEFIFTWKESK